MKQLTLIVRPFVAEKVLAALAPFDVQACIVDEVKGFGRQKGYLDKYQGSEYSQAFLPKVEISFWVEEAQYRDVVEAVKEAARTGRMGDGKLFVQTAAWPTAIEF